VTTRGHAYAATTRRKRYSECESPVDKLSERAVETLLAVSCRRELERLGRAGDREAFVERRNTMTDRISKTVASYDRASELAACEVLLGVSRRHTHRRKTRVSGDARRIAFSSLPLELLRFSNSFTGPNSCPRDNNRVVIDNHRLDCPSDWSGQHDILSLCGRTLFRSVGSCSAISLVGVPPERRLINNVSPIRAGVRTNTSGSLALLAGIRRCVPSFREDYVGLMALRNHDRIPTTWQRRLSSVD